MPLYEMECPQGHVTETLRRYEQRDDPKTCKQCDQPMTRIVSRSHCPPDGVYSYAPNIGDPERFERQREAIKSGKKVIPRAPTKGDLERQHDPARPKGTFFAR